MATHYSEYLQQGDLESVEMEVESICNSAAAEPSTISQGTNISSSSSQTSAEFPPITSSPTACYCGGTQSSKSSESPPVAKSSLETLGLELICAFCHEFFVEASTIECGHSFCRMCIENWLKIRLTCPICRVPISKPPVASLCLDNAVRVMIEIAEEKAAKSELIERQKMASKMRENECFAQTCLETLFQRAIQQGVRVVHISKQWSPREQQRFLGGIERHQGVARETYCKVVGLTYAWIGRASIDELLIAAANVQLRDPQENKVKNPGAWKESCVAKLRCRLEMYIRYG